MESRTHREVYVRFGGEHPETRLRKESAGCLAYKDQKNKPGEGFHVDCVKLGTAERWDRLWLVFAWAYYWLNVAGWDVEVRGDARQWRANTVPDRTHALGRLGHWALMKGGLSWRMICRRQSHFTHHIASVGSALAPT